MPVYRYKVPQQQSDGWGQAAATLAQTFAGPSREQMLKEAIGRADIDRNYAASAYDQARTTSEQDAFSNRRRAIELASNPATWGDPEKLRVLQALAYGFGTGEQMRAGSQNFGQGAGLDAALGGDNSLFGRLDERPLAALIGATPGGDAGKTGYGIRMDDRTKRYGYDVKAAADRYAADQSAAATVAAAGVRAAADNKAPRRLLVDKDGVTHTYIFDPDNPNAFPPDHILAGHVEVGTSPIVDKDGNLIVNNNNWSNVQSKFDNAYLNETMNAVAIAGQDMPRVKQAINLLSSGAARTGLLENTILAPARALVYDLTGVDVGAADQQVVMSTLGTFVMGQIQSTKGAVSDREMAYFKQISPSLANTPWANVVILLGYQEAQSRRVNAFERANQEDMRRRSAGEPPLSSSEVAAMVRHETEKALPSPEQLAAKYGVTLPPKGVQFGEDVNQAPTQRSGGYNWRPLE